MGHREGDEGAHLGGKHEKCSPHCSYSHHQPQQLAKQLACVPSGLLPPCPGRCVTRMGHSVHVGGLQSGGDGLVNPLCSLRVGQWSRPGKGGQGLAQENRAVGAEPAPGEREVG